MLASFSKYLENAVNEIAKLPGIGRRTALRLALHLVKAEKAEVNALTTAIDNLCGRGVHFGATYSRCFPTFFLHLSFQTT